MSSPASLSQTNLAVIGDLGNFLAQGFAAVEGKHVNDMGDCGVVEPL